MAKRKQDWEVRMDAFEQRTEAFQKRHIATMESIDRRLNATSKLLKYGAKLLIEIQESQKQFVEIDCTSRF
jgi:hypothetical protein